MKKFVLLLLIGLLGWSCSYAQELSASEWKIIDSLTHADVRTGSPGLAVGIVRGGEVVYQSYAGYADLEGERWIDETTRFNVASNGKQFTALAIQQLIAEGKLSLADDVREYLPQLYPAYDGHITIGELLNHSAGLRDVYALWSLQGITWWEHTFNNADALALLAQQGGINFTPGTEYLYSNSNYLVLAEVVRVITGQSFAEYTQGMFEQLGMAATGFEDDHEKIALMAKPYFQWSEWEGYAWLSDLVGDGGLFTTLPDQLVWERALQLGSGAGISEGILQQSQRPIPDSDIKQYGYGLEFAEYRGKPYRFHEGITGAWKASTLRLDDPQISVVVMTNSGAVIPAQLSRQLADVLLAVPSKRATSQTAPEESGEPLPESAILGTYGGGGFYFRFVKRNGQLWLERPQRDAVALEAESGRVYHEINDPRFKQQFLVDSVGQLSVTAYHTSHAPYTLTRVPSVPADYSLAEWNGCYANDETDVRLCLEVTEEGGLVATLNDRTYPAELFVADELLVRGYRLHASRNAEGKVNGFWLANDRLRRVWFGAVEN